MFGKWKSMGNWQDWEERGARASRRGSRNWGWRRPKYNVPVNIIDNDTEFIVHVHAVTFPKENIKVTVMDDMLYITGTREPEELYPNFLLHEFPIKSFERSFELSDRVDRKNIQAKYDNGILTVTVGKTHSAQAPEHEVEIE